jgi:hypothetical protein
MYDEKRKPLSEAMSKFSWQKRINDFDTELDKLARLKTINPNTR